MAAILNVSIRLEHTDDEGVIAFSERIYTITDIQDLEKIISHAGRTFALLAEGADIGFDCSIEDVK
jgi:hypothetical protein